MIHPLAFVDETATIGDGTKVWQFASVIRNAVIGSDCVIGSGAQIDGARIGDDCRIENGVSVPHGVHIGNRVFVGPHAVFCNDMWPDATRDGIDHEMVAKSITVRVEDGASIGAGAIVLPGVTVHSGAFVAAGAVVDRDVPPGMIWQRNGFIGPLPEKRERMRFAC